MSTAQYLIWDEANNAYVGIIAPLVRDSEIARRFPKKEAERICFHSKTFDPPQKQKVMFYSVFA